MDVYPFLDGCAVLPATDSDSRHEPCEGCALGDPGTRDAGFWHRQVTGVVMRPEGFMWSLAIFQLAALCASHQRSGLRGSRCLVCRSGLS